MSDAKEETNGKATEDPRVEPVSLPDVVIVEDNVERPPDETPINTKPQVKPVTIDFEHLNSEPLDDVTSPNI